MSQGNYTETTTTSWFTRIGNSFKGILTGIILILLASWFVYWNEGRSVRTAGAIAEAELVTVDMPDISVIDPSFNDKVVYAMGLATTSDTVADHQFGISTVALSLDRDVQYYQWVESSESETVTRTGGTQETVTTYSYSQDWVSAPINSSSFKQPEHVNTTITSIPLDDESWQANNVMFGAYKLPDFMVSSISNSMPLELNLGREQMGNIEGILAPAAPIRSSSSNPRTSRQPSVPTADRIHVMGNQIYLGANQGAPQVGDVMITYTYTPDTDISIVAQVNNNTFDRFIASNGNSFVEVSSSQASKESIFESARSSNSMMTWAFRIIGLLLIIGGFKMIFAPLVVLADVLPFLGDIVGAGTGMVSTILGIAWTFVVAAIAWIRFRPVLAFILLGLAAALAVFLIIKGKKSKKEAPAA